MLWTFDKGSQRGGGACVVRGGEAFVTVSRVRCVCLHHLHTPPREQSQSSETRQADFFLLLRSYFFLAEVYINLLFSVLCCVPTTRAKLAVWRVTVSPLYAAEFMLRDVCGVSEGESENLELVQLM